MRRLTWIAVSIAVANLVVPGAHAQEAAAGADQREGLSIALSICATCHVASPEQAGHPILRPPAPDFATIANRPGVTAESLRAYVLTTHVSLKSPHDMPNPQLSENQATAVVGYLLSLRKAP